MKSRLMPPPPREDRESPSDLPQQQSRRETDQVPLESETAENQVEPTPTVEPYEPAPRPAPQVSARPKGRLMVAGILLACVVSIGCAVWSNFLRDAAYGKVVGKVTALSPPWSGTLTAIHVRPGESVRQGELLAIVYDPELEATIERLQDDARAAQAELDSQVAILALAARRRGNETEALRANYFDLRGQLLAERARHEELSNKLQRRRELVGRKAFSHEEIESLQFVREGVAAKVENLELAVETLATRLASLKVDDHETGQLQPQLAKIENFQAEIARLREKQRRGTLRAPMHGTIIDVAGRVGERATPEQALLEFLPTGALELVIYVQQHQAPDYQVGRTLEVIVEPLAKPIACRITRLGNRLETSEVIISGRYHSTEKKLPVYLTPTDKLPEATELRIDSTVRLPTNWLGL